ncbi:hypothetical protein, partial [Blastococcus sp. TF02A-30]|uniref:hypothetical protein n=1 Tax=Blastococcus sp. TF02A-30 TaxID=2250580 RepID=UPI001F1DE9EF
SARWMRVRASADATDAPDVTDESARRVKSLVNGITTSDGDPSTAAGSFRRVIATTRRRPAGAVPVRTTIAAGS